MKHITRAEGGASRESESGRGGQAQKRRAQAWLIIAIRRSKTSSSLSFEIRPTRYSMIPESAVNSLAQDHIVALERGDHQSRPSLCRAEVGEVEDYNIAFYKWAQAESSSGASESFAKAASAASVGIDASTCGSLSARRNASSLSRSCSGMWSNSRAIISRLLITASVLIVGQFVPSA